MNKIFRKRINIRRREQFNRKLALQVIFSILLVSAVIATKNMNSDLSRKIINAADEKMNASIKILEIRDTITEVAASARNKLPFISKKTQSVPVVGTVYRKYGINKTGEESFYNHGIDIKSETQSVKSITEGKVISIGNNENLSGYIVVQNHDKTFIYGKIKEPFVKEGDTISQGDIIGALDEENMILHIEVWEDGASINPLEFLDLKN
ncbi:MAG TPA: M23 family metallopeptidase [Tissierellia bacterium]|nr:M23 family metallopeptidase [Tissierellia bacterium]